MATLKQLICKDRGYLEFKRKKRNAGTKQELAHLESIILGVANEQLSEWRRRVTKLQADVANEKLRGEVAAMTVQLWAVRRERKGLLLALARVPITAWGDIPGLFAANTLALPEPSPGNNAELVISEKLEQNGSIDTAPEPLANSGLVENVYQELPGWLRIAVDVISWPFRRTTPLSSAIIIIAVVFASIYGAREFNQRLSENYAGAILERDEARAERDQLKKEQQAQENAKLRLIEVETDRDALLANLMQHTEQLTQKQSELNAAITNHSQALIEQQKQHDAQLADARSNLDAATKTALEDLRRQIETLTHEKASWDSARSKMMTELTALQAIQPQLTDLKARLQGQIEKTQEALEAKEKAQSEATQLAQEFGDLAEFTRSLVAITKDLFKAAASHKEGVRDSERAKFRQTFTTIYNAKSSLLQNRASIPTIKF